MLSFQVKLWTDRQTGKVVNQTDPNYLPILGHKNLGKKH